MELIQMKKLIIFLVLFFSTLHAEEKQYFDPVQVAKEETIAWKDYYNSDVTGLIQHLSHLVIVEFRLNQMTAWTSVIPELATAAAIFHHLPANSSQATYESDVLPHLHHAYESIRKAWNGTWDSEQAAKDELAWWIYRREKNTSNPEIVGRKITDLYQLIYGKEDHQHFAKAGYLRAVAAHYRDLCQHTWKDISELDWSIIENVLVESYKEMLMGIKENIKH